MINKDSAQRVASLLKDHNGKLIHGGEFDIENKYISPTVILNPALDAPIMQDEIFGPILLVIPIKNIEEAI